MLDYFLLKKKLYGIFFVMAFIFSSTGCSRPDIAQLKAEGDVAGLIRTLGWVEGIDAREALIEIGEEAVDPLIGALKKKDEDTAVNAAYALGKIGGENALEALIAALEHNDTQVSWEAGIALSNFDDPRAAEALVDKIRRVPEERPAGYEDNELGYAGSYIYALSRMGMAGLDAINAAMRIEYDVFLKQAANLIAPAVLRDRALPVCQGVPIESVEYDAGKKGLHRMAVTRIDGNYSETAMVNGLPAMWMAVDDPLAVELVLCFDTDAVKVETCRYNDGSTINRYQTIYYFWLREAATTVELDHLELQGSYPPPCPASKDISQYNLSVSQGDQPSLEALEEWLAGYVEVKE